MYDIEDPKTHTHRPTKSAFLYAIKECTSDLHGSEKKRTSRLLMSNDESAIDMTLLNVERNSSLDVSASGENIPLHYHKPTKQF